MGFYRTGIVEQSRLWKRRFADALDRTRLPRPAPADVELVTKGSTYMHLVSHRDRNKFFRILWEEFAGLLGLDDKTTYPDFPLFWVTLVDRSCCTPAREWYVDIEGVKRRFAEGLHGLSYVGMIDVAYYVNSRVGKYRKPFLSWHLHAICWGASSEKMKERFERLNSPSNKRRYRPVAEGMTGADCRPIPNQMLASGLRTHLEDKFRYMAKPPLQAYRLFKRHKLDAYGQVGSNNQQKPSPLSPAELIRLFHVIKHLFLDDMIVGAGRGMKIVRRTEQRALKGFRSYFAKNGLEELPQDDRFPYEPLDASSWPDLFR